MWNSAHRQTTQKIQTENIKILKWFCIIVCYACNNSLKEDWILFEGSLECLVCVRLLLCVIVCVCVCGRVNHKVSLFRHCTAVSEIHATCKQGCDVLLGGSAVSAAQHVSIGEMFRMKGNLHIRSLKRSGP